MSNEKTYTVAQVAKLSGISVRTLHFYDEIGLLKPKLKGANQYRYYGTEQLLLLQQILFYRELGFSLDQIQEIVSDPKFDKVKALRSHRKALEKDAVRLQSLIQTLDNTIASLEGEKSMKNEDLYKGFSPEKQKEYEEYLISRGGEKTREHIEESKKRMKHWSKEQIAQSQQSETMLREITKHAVAGTPLDDLRVQKLIDEHYRWVCLFWTPQRDSYIGLGQLYVEHPDFRKFYEAYDPKLVDYLAAAMKVYAESKL